MCDDTSMVPHNATNRWPVYPFESLSAHGAQKLRDDDKICTDVLFHGVQVPTAFETVIGILATMGVALIMWTARLDT